VVEILGRSLTAAATVSAPLGTVSSTFERPRRKNGQMRRLPTPRPGVTAAATTAVFATGEGPGVTALATTAVFATGWPMTPTRPTRAGL